MRGESRRVSILFPFQCQAKVASKEVSICPIHVYKKVIHRSCCYIIKTYAFNMELTLSAPLTAWAGKGAAKTPDPATTAMEAAVPMVWVMKSRRLLLLSLLLLLCFSLVVANRAVTVLAWVDCCCCCGVVNADAEWDAATANERRQKDAESFMML
jgi:hypothetical protein